MVPMLVIFFTFANYTMPSEKWIQWPRNEWSSLAKRDIVRPGEDNKIDETHTHTQKSTELLNWIKQPQWIALPLSLSLWIDGITPLKNGATKRKHWIYFLAYHQQLDMLTWYRLLLPLAQVLFHSIDDPIDSALMDIRVELKGKRGKREIIRFFCCCRCSFVSSLQVRGSRRCL